MGLLYDKQMIDGWLASQVTRNAFDTEIATERDDVSSDSDITLEGDCEVEFRVDEKKNEAQWRWSTHHSWRRLLSVTSLAPLELAPVFQSAQWSHSDYVAEVVKRWTKFCLNERVAFWGPNSCANYYTGNAGVEIEGDRPVPFWREFLLFRTPKCHSVVAGGIDFQVIDPEGNGEEADAEIVFVAPHSATRKNPPTGIPDCHPDTLLRICHKISANSSFLKDTFLLWTRMVLLKMLQAPLSDSSVYVADFQGQMSTANVEWKISVSETWQKKLIRLGNEVKVYGSTVCVYVEEPKSCSESYATELEMPAVVLKNLHEEVQYMQGHRRRSYGRWYTRGDRTFFDLQAEGRVWEAIDRLPGVLRRVYSGRMTLRHLCALTGMNRYEALGTISVPASDICTSASWQGISVPCYALSLLQKGGVADLTENEVNADGIGFPELELAGWSVGEGQQVYVHGRETCALVARDGTKTHILRMDQRDISAMERSEVNLNQETRRI